MFEPTRTMTTVSSHEPALIPKAQQGIYVDIAPEIHRPTISPITSIRSSSGHKLFPPATNTSITTFSTDNVYVSLINHAIN